MKVLTTSLFSLLIATFFILTGCENIDAQQTSDVKVVAGPQLEFANASFDFGHIRSGEKVNHEFEFTNTGSAPLVIKDVKTTCGCTVSSFPKEPIMPGEKNVIQASFNSKGKSGKQNKVITVITNTEEGTSKVALVGSVEAVEGAETTAANKQ